LQDFCSVLLLWIQGVNFYSSDNSGLTQKSGEWGWLYDEGKENHAVGQSYQGNNPETAFYGKGRENK